MNQPKVSIIVPIYNVEKYLDRCVQSLMHQTLKDIEIILVDDGSPDNCPTMCDEYAKQDARIKVIHKQNAGLGMARNSGIEIATGEYVGFIDSDDYAGETMFETMYNNAKSDNLDACFCDICSFDNKGNKRINTNLWGKTEFMTRSEVDALACHVLAAPIDKPYLVEVPMAAWNGIYRGKLFKEYNMRFRSERVYVSEDVMFHADCMKYYNRVEWISKPLVYHFLDNTASLTHRFSMKKCDSILRMARTLIDVVRTNYKKSDFEPYLYGYLINSYSNTIFSICTMDTSFSKRITNIISFSKRFRDFTQVKKFPSKMARYKFIGYCFNRNVIKIMSLCYIIRNGLLGELKRRLTYLK